MKTIQQISEECAENIANECFSDEIQEWTDYILAAITAAVEEERNRTCEWVDSVPTESPGYFTAGCSGRAWNILRHSAASRCPDCGSKIVVKGEN